jgi:hypothetical protein
MNANELMLGNYVTIDNPKAWSSYKNIPMVVTQIYSYLSQKEKEIWNKSNGTISLIFKHNTFSQFSEFIRPIALTEKWLLDFGFFKFNNAYVLQKPIENCLDFEFSIWEDLTYNTAEIKPDISNVHQLQNLYFSLTGNHLQLVEQTNG